MSVKNYDPKKISVIIAGLPITGFADGTFAKVARDEDAFTAVVGATGEVTRVQNANKMGKLTITLLGSSASNDYLSSLATADEISGAGTFGAMVKDNKGTSLYGAATAWIAKSPDAEWSKENNGHREWVIATDELIVFAGGSN